MNSNIRGDSYVLPIGHIIGADVDAELQALTEVPAGAGYEVTSDPEHEVSVFVRLASGS
ncbi:hypothetical protein [Streptosporangium sp. NPDC051022]|uniref:hypothetical protein n=1 Tax=Streptosporangium sp. NPDC051022 TaxID=3155752 RepID=UPI00342DE8BA